MRLIVVDKTKCDPLAEPANERDVTQDQLDPSIGLLIRELQHRIQNLFAVVQCFVNQTDSATASEYRAALSARIASLADAYKLIERTRSRRISLIDLLEQTLRPYAATGRPDRICARGPNIELEPKLALSLHMVFHELATNASKHGALSAKDGRVGGSLGVGSGLNRPNIGDAMAGAGWAGGAGARSRGFRPSPGNKSTGGFTGGVDLR
jgi:two-component sensor histidine kinase